MKVFVKKFGCTTDDFGLTVGKDFGTIGNLLPQKKHQTAFSAAMRQADIINPP